MAIPTCANAQQPETQIRVSVRLVNIVASVRGPAGELASTLEKDDLEVLEEGVAQQVRVFARESDLPLSIALLVDSSLSTAKDLKVEQEAATRFIRSILRPQDRIALFTFTQDVTMLSPFTSHAERVERALRSIRPQGATSLYDAIYLAALELRGRSGRKVMILITDGGDTTSRSTFHQALRAAQDADTVIYCVVVVPIPGLTGKNVAGENALELFAQGTGGRTLLATASALDQAFAAIGEELRTHYVLGYYASADLEPGAYRHIEVRVRKPGFTVRARKGYYLKD